MHINVDGGKIEIDITDAHSEVNDWRNHLEISKTSCDYRALI
jgi:hypothetical protein